jgi:hypothetical protein
MTFTFSQARPLKPQEVNPFANLVSNALHGYSQGMKAAYLPQEIEADIFSKKLGPLATLATTPMFLQNPQFQEALGNMIMQALPYGGKEFTGIHPNKLPTYANQVNKDVQEAKGYAANLSKAGKGKVAISGAAGTTENYLGDMGKHLINAFNGMFGTHISSGLAKEQNAFADKINNFKNIAIQTHKLTRRDAEETFSLKKNETPEQGLKRMMKQNPWLFEQGGETESNAPMDKEDENNRDNIDLTQAAKFSKQIQKKYGIDVPETLIFNYMQQRPGDIDLMDLLKTAGISDAQLKKAGLK